MAECLFIKADEVVKMLGVSQSEAYRIIKKLNEEMAAKGYISHKPGKLQQNHRSCALSPENFSS